MLGHTVQQGFNHVHLNASVAPWQYLSFLMQNEALVGVITLLHVSPGATSRTIKKMNTNVGKTVVPLW